MNSNLPIYYKSLLGDKWRITNKKFKRTLKIPLIFYHIINFLDDEALFEIRYVCQIFAELISQNPEVDYKIVKILLERIKAKKKLISDFFYTDTLKLLKLDTRKSMANYLKWDGDKKNKKAKNTQTSNKYTPLDKPEILTIERRIEDCYKLPCEENGMLEDLFGVKFVDKLSEKEIKTIKIESVSKDSLFNKSNFLSLTQRALCNPYGLKNDNASNLKIGQNILNYSKKAGQAIHKGLTATTKQLSKIDDKILEYLISKNLI